MAALGEMTLRAVMGALALILGPHWAVSDPEARAWGEAFEAWLKAQPAKRRKALVNALGAVPTLNLVVTTGMIIAPRVQATVAMTKAQREVKSEERERSASGNRAGSGESSATPPSGDYASAIAKALGGDAGGPSPGSSPDDTQVFPKA